MKSENQYVVTDKSSQKRLMFVHISARSNLMAETLTKANLEPPDLNYGRMVFPSLLVNHM